MKIKYKILHSCNWIEVEERFDWELYYTRYEGAKLTLVCPWPHLSRSKYRVIEGHLKTIIANKSSCITNTVCIFKSRESLKTDNAIAIKLIYKFSLHDNNYNNLWHN